jgi:radical SAM protein with 4Fe4S-binding SPASM domain
MGIRPNGDVTPCPYLPLFAGNLRRESLTDLWRSSELFVNIRERSRLGGRCGQCELAASCGGCRARAFGMTGDVLAEDPLCTHTPGTFAKPTPAAVEYGEAAQTTIPWDPAASERMQQIPAFVRGMVARRVEAYCRERRLARVTEEVLGEIRAKMPTPKLFAANRG